MYSEPEDDPIDDEEIEFESDKEDVVTAGYEAEEGAGTRRLSCSKSYDMIRALFFLLCV